MRREKQPHQPIDDFYQSASAYTDREPDNEHQESSLMIRQVVDSVLYLAGALVLLAAMGALLFFAVIALTSGAN